METFAYISENYFCKNFLEMAQFKDAAESYLASTFSKTGVHEKMKTNSDFELESEFSGSQN